MSEQELYLARARICDLGYLRESYRNPDGRIEFRCPSEPVTIYVAKAGKVEDTIGRKCLCNALLANIGHPQVRNGKHIEQGLVTSGDDLTDVARFLAPGASTYKAADVVSALCSPTNKTTPRMLPPASKLDLENKACASCGDPVPSMKTTTSSLNTR